MSVQSDDQSSADSSQPSPMFKADIKADVLESFLDRPLAMVSEAKLQLGTGGLSITAVDAANVGMVDVQLRAPAFEKYESDGAMIGVDLERFADVVDMANSGDVVHVYLDEETRKLHVEAGTMDFEIGLIDPDMIRQEPDIPDVDLPATVTLSGAQLSRAHEGSDMVARSFTLAMDDEAFTISADGDTDRFSERYTERDVEHMSTADAEGMYSVDYFKDIVKTLSKDDHVTVKLGQELPTQVEMAFAGGKGHVEYMVAPRIDK